MSIRSLVESGTKVWLDSVDPKCVEQQRPWGISGATSNPIIISDLIKTGRFDDHIRKAMGSGAADAALAWDLTHQLVCEVQDDFEPIWLRTRGDDGYVSFELDPLLEDPAARTPVAVRMRQYVDLAKKWGLGQKNRMIKVPATEAGIAALEDIAAAGLHINVTLIFTARQYRAARDAVWRGAQRREGGLATFKSVYSIFISRVDVYTDKHVPTLSAAAQGMVGIVNAKRVWLENQEFWNDRNTPLKQEIIFASTGTKKPADPKDKYVAALAGSDIQTNPPETNEAAEKSQKPYTRQVDHLPADALLREIDEKVDQQKMEAVLLAEGVEKFAKPQHALLKLIGEKRASMGKR